MNRPEVCKETLFRDGAWNPSRCLRRATRDGFCGIHHPDAEKKRREKSNARYASEERVRQHRYAIVRAERNVVSAALAAEHAEGSALGDAVAELLALRASRTA